MFQLTIAGEDEKECPAPIVTSSSWKTTSKNVLFECRPEYFSNRWPVLNDLDQNRAASSCNTPQRMRKMAVVLVEVSKTI